MLEILTNLIQEHPVIIRAVGLGAFIAGDYLPDILDYAKRKKLGVRLRYSYRRMRDDDIYDVMAGFTLTMAALGCMLVFRGNPSC